MRPNSPTRPGRCVLIVGLVCSLVLAAAAPASAAPRIYVDDADLESDRVLAGDEVRIHLNMNNRGDEGALTVEIFANETVVGEERVRVEADSRRNVTTNITIDEPGRYEIEANDERVGTLRVVPAVGETVLQREDGQTLRVRAVDVDPGQTLNVTFPDTTDNVSIDSLTMTSDGDPFERTVDTYTRPGNAPFPVPDSDGSAVVAAVAFQEIEGVEDESFVLTFDRSALGANDLSESRLQVYRYDETGYAPVETTVLESTPTNVTYEVAANGSNYVVGEFQPAVAVRDRTVDVTRTEEGWRFEGSVTVGNDGPVPGNYTTSMAVNGETVDERTVTVPAGENTTATLEYVTTDSGDYDIAVDGDVVQSASLRGGGQTDSEDTTADDRTDADEESADGEAQTDTQAESADGGTEGGESGATDAESGTEGDETDDGLELSAPTLDDLGVRNVAIGAGVSVLIGGIVLLRRL